MKTIERTVDIEASPEEVFDLVHDYSRRLEWDPFLKRADILEGATTASAGVKTRCVARNALGGIAMETVYLTFRRPRVAAVRMTAGPYFLEDFVASIRQLPLPGGRTRVSYKFRFAARPRWLRPIAHPIFAWVFRRETAGRLRGLKRYLESRPRPATTGER